jgi:hypothetical protein
MSSSDLASESGYSSGTYINTNTESEQHRLEITRSECTLRTAAEDTYLKDKNSQQVRPPDDLERCPPDCRPRVAVLGHTPSRNSYECLNAVAEAFGLPRRDLLELAVVHARKSMVSAAR